MLIKYFISRIKSVFDFTDVLILIYIFRKYDCVKMFGNLLHTFANDKMDRFEEEEVMRNRDVLLIPF